MNNDNIVWFRGDKPIYATENSAGCDLIANDDFVLKPFERQLIKTNLTIAPDNENWAGFVCPRSGLALKSGITVLNAPGICDSDYRGNVGVILINLSNETYQGRKGDRVAQLVFVEFKRAEFLDRIDQILPETARGSGGFGHSGR